MSDTVRQFLARHPDTDFVDVMIADQGPSVCGQVFVFIRVRVPPRLAFADKMGAAAIGNRIVAVPTRMTQSR